MSNKNFKESFGSGGYYIALILCAVAIGISGYLYYRNNTKTKAEPDRSVIATEGNQPDVGALSTQPVTSESSDPTEPSQTQQATKPAVIHQPVEGQTIAPYAMDALSYNQTTRDWRTHNGVDIGAEAGTQVCAVADGQVYTVYEDETMGTTVVIRHEGGYVTTYSSMDANLKVSTGENVTAGQVIGSVGNTALMETAIGDHLHFSVSCNGNFVDPEDFLGKE